MRLKSYFANTVEEAIRQARQELGPEAVLVNSKKTGVEAQHLGAYEVVVCTEAPEPVAEASPNRDGARPNRAAVPVDQLSRDVAGLKQQMEKLALTLARSTSGMAGIAFDAELSRAFALLADSEVDTELAYDLLTEMSSPVSPEKLKLALAERIQVDAALAGPGPRQQVVALAGPPGAGKTTTLVKLAVQYGLAARKSIQVLTTDTYRIGAAEELRSYATILSTGFQVLEAPGMLAQGLREYSNKDLILIDTPGFSGRDMETAVDWASALIAADVETHLVLPASMRASDLKRMAAQYAMFRPRKLLFTRLDETETFGALVSLSIRLGTPISFLACGQQIPEDLEPATVDRLLSLLLGSSGVSVLQNEPGARYGAVAA